MKCPECGSDKISFQREQLRCLGKRYITVCVCQHCGHDWKRDKSHGTIYNILSLLLWPFFVTAWFYKTPLIRLQRCMRIIIIAAVWSVLLVYILLTQVYV
ncbi:MAG: hypothetical protein IJB86_05090 [Clostridia bacterium]|nr:hypothetical protein [Clostridia bacterium]